MCREETWLTKTLRTLVEKAHKNSVGGIECHVQRGSGNLRRSVHRKRA